MGGLPAGREMEALRGILGNVGVFGANKLPEVVYPKARLIIVGQGFSLRRIG